MRPEALSSFQCRLGDETVTATITPDAVSVAGRSVSYLDIDDVVVEDHTVRLVGPGDDVVLDALGRGRDDFLLELRRARAPVRRAALLQWGASAPIDEYRSRGEDGDVIVTLFSEGVTIEPPIGPPTFVPLSLIERVDRDGYAFTFLLRGLESVVVTRLGKRTDEFLLDLERTRNELTERTASAYAELDESLAGLDAPDGWAVNPGGAGARWAALRGALAGGSRAPEIDTLASLAGERLRLGIKVATGSDHLPFALAPVGGRVAVEAADTEARATFVFACDDVDRLNAALLLTSFRREAISLPEAELGRWAVAVRCLEVVRWARQALVARIVHDDNWDTNVRAALGAS